MASFTNRKLTGLVAATFTPLTPQGELNLPVIGPYVDYLVEKQGVLNVFVNGTTGEGVSLCTEERKRLTEEWCRRGKGKLNQVIVHVGCYSLKDSQELARHAAGAGANGIAVIAPSFFKSATADGIRRFLQEIAAEAPTLPFYYYHIPAMTGLSLRARDVLEGIDALIPTFRGLKFSGSDLMDFGQCVSYAKPHWSLLYGVDEQLLAALSMGANGAVGSTFNYFGSLANSLLMAYGKGDVCQARTLQLQMQEFLCPAVKQGFDVAMNKQLMSTLSGLALGPPRLPLLPCPAQLTLSVAERIQQVSREHRS
ncbi:N-acetylneuraminate lyase [Brienomyrus brachyistius]|uniref:N-acetylneuraminate lyase n=1 Tax=Brienomyrus brachyistius TaxID=42636 RepID=UPI0020B2C836|nr:N-acetylneuraminate lyase [Brienomyrus brachyistius]XP_048833004.1 N-acetylneuraminate lyase [Brienomyrus brachyistius]